MKTDNNNINKVIKSGDNEITFPITHRELIKYIPHRYPFLLIDKVLEVDLNERILALKNVTINEPFFTGHFPNYAVMPGVLIIESMAQTAGILSMLSTGGLGRDELYFFAGINNAKFKRQVIPGDTLLIEVHLIKTLKGVSKFRAISRVDKMITTDAELLIVKKKV